jgi:hypothetical protein
MCMAVALIWQCVCVCVFVCCLPCLLFAAAQSKTRYSLLKAAIATHATFARDAMTGKGVDRHLMGLYILSEMSGITPRPALFSDKGYLKAKTYHLSTSNVSSGAGGFMAMTEEGYGVCYGIQEGLIVFNISSYAVCLAPSSSPPPPLAPAPAPSVPPPPLPPFGCGVLACCSLADLRAQGPVKSRFSP